MSDNPPLLRPPARRPPDPLDFLAGGGAMGELIRSTDWARTPLGPDCLLAAESPQRDQHPPAVAGADHPLLGGRPHRAL